VPSQAVRTPGVLAPLPMISLGATSRDGSMIYMISRIDASGTISATQALDALSWNSGDQIDVSTERGVVILRRNAQGLHVVSKKRNIVVPAAARRACGILAGESVLLAAAARHEVLLIHPESVLNAMMALYHAASQNDEPT
jgi:hypothetical protein